MKSKSTIIISSFFTILILTIICCYFINKDFCQKVEYSLVDLWYKSVDKKRVQNEYPIIYSKFFAISILLFVPFFFDILGKGLDLLDNYLKILGIVLRIGVIALYFYIGKDIFPKIIMYSGSKTEMNGVLPFFGQILDFTNNLIFKYYWYAVPVIIFVVLEIIYHFIYRNSKVDNLAGKTFGFYLGSSFIVGVIIYLIPILFSILGAIAYVLVAIIAGILIYVLFFGGIVKAGEGVHVEDEYINIGPGYHKIKIR